MSARAMSHLFQFSAVFIRPCSDRADLIIAKKRSAIQVNFVWGLTFFKTISLPFARETRSSEHHYRHTHDFPRAWRPTSERSMTDLHGTRLLSMVRKPCQRWNLWSALFSYSLEKANTIETALPGLTVVCGHRSEDLDAVFTRAPSFFMALGESSELCTVCDTTVNSYA